MFEENSPFYGVGKVWPQMMREMDLQGLIRGKPTPTTVSDRAAPSHSPG